MPVIEPPPVEPGKPARIFELRTYESNNAATLRRKVRMFEQGGELVAWDIGVHDRRKKLIGRRGQRRHSRKRVTKYRVSAF